MKKILVVVVAILCVGGLVYCADTSEKQKRIDSVKMKQDLRYPEGDERRHFNG